MGSSVKIFSVATGKVVSIISATPGSSAPKKLKKGGHTDLITSIVINPQNPFQLFTASLDGCIKIWDFMDAALLRTIDMGKPLTHICASPKVKDYVFVAAKLPPKKKDNDNGA